MLLKKRVCIEHVINKFKQYKRIVSFRKHNKNFVLIIRLYEAIQLRYDRNSENFKSYVFMTALSIVIQNTLI